MSYRNIILFFIFFIIISPFEGQKGDEMSPYQEYLLQLKEYRKNCRNALKPFRYEGSDFENKQRDANYHYHIKSYSKRNRKNC